MRLTAHRRRPVRIIMAIWVVAVGCALGCHAPQGRDFGGTTPGFFVSTVQAKQPILAPAADTVVIAAPKSQDARALAAVPSSVETWIVHTRACEQKLGSDPWSSITIGRLDEGGGPLHAAEPDALFARMSGRPSVFFVHGAGYTYQDAVEEAVNIRTVLEANGGFSPETLFVAFDWPSERELGDFIQDLNEQSRRSRVASYHLARFLQSAPPDSRICLMGQSNGGRIVLMAVHLLSGAPLQPFWTEPEVALTSSRSDLRIRAVLVDAAAGHHWLNPGERLHQALPMCESLLNLRNCADYALSVYVFGIYTGLRPPIGQVGLTARDLRVLGPLSARVEQINMHSRVGFSHTSIPQALGLPDIAERIAHYTSWSDVSQPARR